MASGNIPSLLKRALMRKRRILGMVMAGGRGTRLEPLTLERSKPAVPFGGKYRIIDFVLSNFINSGIYSIYVLTQFKSQSLAEHMHEVWSFTNALNQDQFITAVPAQMRVDQRWYEGTADSIHQNLHMIKEFNPSYVCIFGGDHIYKMDISQMVDYHEEKDADATVAAITVPIEEATEFGVVEVNRDWRIIGFEEKPANPKPLPNDPGLALVSMGNYVFNKKTLVQELEQDHGENETQHDFGKNIIPGMIKYRDVYAYDFRRNYLPGMEKWERNDYWRDVGTLDAYYEANMDLKSIDPEFNLYNSHWPIRTYEAHSPPAKFVHNEEGRIGYAVSSIISNGSIISGAKVEGSILGPEVRVHSYASVTNSVLLDDVEICRNAKIKNAIIDKHVRIEEGETVGYDLDKDRTKGYTITPNGIVVIKKCQREPIFME
jgi:glucose-1-phosphate adenylyltransferase